MYYFPWRGTVLCILPGLYYLNVKTTLKVGIIISLSIIFEDTEVIDLGQAYRARK